MTPVSSDSAEPVLIRTLPLSNGNYGGILQAYALQRVLVDLGLAPVTDLSVSNPLPPFGKAVARAVLFRMPAWCLRTRAAAEALDSVLADELAEPLNEFVTEFVAGVELFSLRGAVDTQLLARYRTLLVGSDQVWRHRYGDVRSFLFDFVADQGVRRVSYAASFGQDHLEGYSRRLIRSTAELARRFDSISVREESAVRICAEQWGLAARQHIDPTLLLTRGDYASVAARGTALSPDCLTYVLDASDRSRACVESVCRNGGLRETRLHRRPASYAEFASAPARYRRSTVPTWVRAFADARFVVTDSFHGTAFAIIMNTPFVAIANPGRGATRFDTLLGTVGLSDRLVSSAEEAKLTASRAIEWDRVNKVLERKRGEGIDYLRSALRAPSAAAPGRRD